MHPILFRIPMPGWDLPIVGKVDAIPIYAYGVMLGLSLVVGWYLTLGLCKRDGLPRETMANNYVITAIVAVVMSRVLYVVTNPEEFNTTWEIISFRGGGLVAYGGFIGGFLGSFAYLRYKKIPLLPWADVAVPSLAIGTAITRIGCYLFGCDYGRPLTANAPGWVKKLGTFPRWSEEVGIPGSPAWSHHTKSNLIDVTAEHSLPVHPTQLYEMLIGAGLLAFLLWARKRQTFRGQIFFLWAFTYGFLRFLLEIVRDDPERGLLPGSLPEHIFLPLCLMLFAVGYALSIANMIPNLTVRRVTQVAGFVPPIVAFFWLKPPAFAGPVLMQLSSSQGIALASVAVCAFYFVFDKAAREHPEAAMDLNLPESELEKEEEPAPQPETESKPKATEDTPAEPAKKKTKKKKKKRAAGA